MMKYVFVALLTCFPALSAHAATLTAYSRFPSINSDFTIEFTDTGDGLLQFEEITAFSGFFWGTLFYDRLMAVPDVANVSSFSYDRTENFALDSSRWVFKNDQTGFFTYPPAGDSAFCYEDGCLTVPLPAGLPLFLSGLVGLAALQPRRKRRDPAC